MTPNQPYLLRAFYEWIVDNELTPHIVVDATIEGVDVPVEHVKDGQIILNISSSACAELLIQNDWVSFKARFSGVSRELFVPVPAVLAIFARENGAGTVFMEEEPPGEQDFASSSDGAAHQPVREVPAGAPAEIQPVQSQSTDQNNGDMSNSGTQAAKPAAQKLQSVSSTQNNQSKSADGNDDDPSPTPPRPKGKPSLKVIK